MRLQQQPEASAVHAEIVRDDLQLVGALGQQRVDKDPRDPRQPEAADRNLEPLGMSATASAAEPTTLFIPPILLVSPPFIAPPSHHQPHPLEDGGQILATADAYRLERVAPTRTVQFVDQRARIRLPTGCPSEIPGPFGFESL